MINIILSADYSMGVGDFLVKLYALCHLKKYLKENLNCTVTLLLEEYTSNVLQNILNIEFFKTYFDQFFIYNDSNNTINGLGTNTIIFNNSNYTRQYSAINDHTNNTRGYWEVYSDTNLVVPFRDFDYRDPSTRQSKPIPDYDLAIFNISLIEKAKNFANNQLNNNFDSIYYRSIGDLDTSSLNKTIDKINSYIINNDNSKKYFITTNSFRAKDILLKKIYNSLPYDNQTSQTQDGYGTAASDQSRIEDLFIEMFIMGYGYSIFYGGNQSYISLFNYYAHMLKRVPLVYC